MNDKTKLSEEVDNYFKQRSDALDVVADRIISKQVTDEDRSLKLDGLGFSLEQEESSARITLGVSNLAAFTIELIARGEAWTDHLSRLPDDIREEVLRDDGGITLSGAMHRHDRWTVTNYETDEKFPLWLTQVIHQVDDPILETFYVGHEEGHILHKTKYLHAIHSLWTEYVDDLVNPECLHVNEDALVNLLNDAFEMESMQDNSAITEAVAHLCGLHAAFQKYDPQEAVPHISSGTDTNEFRHVIWLLGYRGDYGIGHDDIRRTRDAIYNWGDAGSQLRQPSIERDADNSSDGSTS